MKNTNQSFLVHKKELNNITISENEIPVISDGEVLLEIEKYAFTTNNITYGIVGFTIGYWKFFPATDPKGIIPVWGYAKVVKSNHGGVEVGERFYGYFPMSNFLKVQIGKNTPFGFFDESPHRAELPKLYNYYSNVKTDVSYDAEKENYAPIFRPLFTTSFLSYHFLKDNSFFDSDQIIITSASSKTGLGLAYLLKKNQGTDGKKIIALTSPRNVEFVKNTGYYDQVIAYPDLGSELNNNTSTIVDMTGNSKLLMEASNYLNENLKFTSRIGLTDWASEKKFEGLTNSKFFFAPSFAQKKYEEWGVVETNQIIAKELSQFTEAGSKWLDLVFIKNNKELSKLYLGMLGGKIDPSKGYLITINE